MKKLIFSIYLALIFYVSSSFGCTLAGKVLSDFDEAEYIFIGEVIGYTQSVKSAKLRQEAFGLVVRVKEGVYLPKIPKTHFEIFPIQLWADCSLSGMPIEVLRKKFPINSEVRVIAKEAEILSNDLSDNNIRLEERPSELSSVALNYDEDKTRMTTINSAFNYKSFKYNIARDSESKYFLPQFEIRKDLFRLKNSQTQKERANILRRLKKVPICCNDLDFQVIFDKYNSAKK